MTDPKRLAQELVAENGPPNAWQQAIRETVDAYLRQDGDAAVYWVAVQQHMRVIAPNPAASDFDVFTSARSLISEFGAQEAWRHAIQKEAEAEGNLKMQVYWLRVAEATTALSKRHNTRRS